MGDQNIHTNSNIEMRHQFIRHLLDDVEALEILLKEGKIEKGITRIGAEQEFCLVNPSWRPSPVGKLVLEEINDPHFTTELAKFNLEINLDPIELKNDAFQKMETQLRELLHKAKNVSQNYDSQVLLTGILPSISSHEVGLEFMTEHARYFALNEMFTKLRGTDFSLHLSGVDELSVKHHTVMFEACNTSFQMHLQIDPEDFINSYNWSQAIAGPVLGISVNSPLLLGRELWQETRIALFQQSIDTRSISQALKDQQPRVTFGDSWAEGSVADIFKNEISRYKIILSKDIEENSLDLVKNGDIPKLKALNLHNGTIYRWNRACYGVGGGKAHVRIENRYIPSGPTVLDEMANFAFWVGLMVGRPKKYDQVHQLMDFCDAKSNFMKSARHGCESKMIWMGEEISLKSLIIDSLLPIAYAGLKKVGVDEKDINRLLAVIEKRVETHTPAQWMIKSYRNLKKKMKPDEALIALTSTIHANHTTQKPVHEWEVSVADESIDSNATKLGHIMSDKLFTAFMNDTVELTINIMKWKNIHHIPVVDENEQLVGLLTRTHIDNLKKKMSLTNESILVSKIMEKDMIIADTSTGIGKAISIMKKNEIGCLPVLQKNQLVGIVTIKDLKRFEHD